MQFYADNTPLPDFVQTGDIIFCASDSWMGRIIRKVTSGKVNHVKLVYNECVTLETDAQFGRAVFTPIPSLTTKGLVIVRPQFIDSSMRGAIHFLCHKYEGAPYSYYDVALNLALTWLKDEWRMDLLTLLGTKKFMKCDELVSRILYEASGRKELKHYEGLTPQDLLQVTLQEPLHYQVLYWNL